MKTYRQGGYALEINSDHVDLWAGSTCVKSLKVRKNEMLIDAIKRTLNSYLKGEGFREYVRICRAIDKVMKLTTEVDEDLYLEYLTTLPARKVRALLTDAERDFA